MKYAEFASELQKFYIEFKKRDDWLQYWKVDKWGKAIKDRDGNKQKNPNFNKVKYQDEMTELGFDVGRYVPLSPLAFIFSLMLNECGLKIHEEWNIKEEDKIENRKFSYDLFVPRLQLLIEVDGKKFHPIPGKCKFCGKHNIEDPEILEKIKRQYVMERFAIISGYKFLRFLRNEIYLHNKENPIPKLDPAAFPLVVGELLELVGSQLVNANLKEKFVNALRNYSNEN